VQRLGPVSANVTAMFFLQYGKAELDRQYDQRAWAPNAAKVIRRYTERSERARAALGEPRVFSYGASPAETLDLYETRAPGAPIHVFIHGGAWRLLSKRDSSFAAENFVRSGVHFITLDFAQLPSVSLTEMVAQVRRAVAWIFQNANEFDGDPSRLHISGHSSGGHLAACVAVTDWVSQFGLPRKIVSSVICASGIYDLLPVRLSARNDYVKLDAQTEHALSPIRHLDSLSAPVFVACGALDSDEFKRQSREFAAALGPSLLAPHAELPALDHFEVVETLADPAYGLGLAALNLIGARRQSA
jgi:arylformamidase